MKIMVVNAHWNNRGDEAAVRAMIDELHQIYPNSEIAVQIMLDQIDQFPYDGNIQAIPLYPRKKDYPECLLTCLTKGHLIFSRKGKQFFRSLREADLVLHAPGGPSIGDIYVTTGEINYLIKFLLIHWFKKPYLFYAPSMGPFRSKKHRRLRRYALNHADMICVREPITKQYLQEQLGIDKEIKVTLDSAFQHPIDVAENEKELDSYPALKEFLDTSSKVAVLTITDLAWNPKYQQDKVLQERIRSSFDSFIDKIIQKGYSVLFIPQLFGSFNDRNYMLSFQRENCFVMDDTHDCYFQQYIISQVDVVVGMRYHSNIFSAKMAIPFISVSYEQKMKGFMQKVGLQDYCIELHNLSSDELLDKFETLEEHYEEYKSLLKKKSVELKEESHRTTDFIMDYIETKDLYEYGDA